MLELKLEDSDKRTPYATSYPHLLEALKGKPITAEGYVAATHMVYGWMPTVLTLTTQSPVEPFALEAAILERARGGEEMTDDDLDKLKTSINNSIVGTSKLLHFVRPDRYAIWDSKVYAYLRAQAHPKWSRKIDHQDVNKISRFKHYTSELRALVQKPEFKPVHDHVNSIFEYRVTALRAAEVLMYAKSPSFKEAKN